MPRVPAVGRVVAAGRVAASGRSTIVEYQQIVSDSQNPAGANWVDLQTTRVGAFGANPFGSANDSVQVRETASGVAEHAIYRNSLVQFTTTGFYTQSVWLRTGTRNFGGINCDFAGPPPTFAALWNLTTGANTLSVVGAGPGPFYGTAIQIGTWPTPSVAGWRRYYLTFEVLQVPTPFVFIRGAAISATGAAVAYAGVAGENIEMWNPQLVKSNWPGPVQQSNPGTVNATSSLRLLVENT